MDEAALNEAKDEALGSDVIVEEEEAVEEVDETVEETVEEEVEVEEEVVVDEDYDDLLPDDHKKRSGLGRKLHSMNTRLEAQDEHNSKILTILERLTESNESDETDTEYVTKAELKQFQASQVKESTKYQDDFKSVFHTLSAGMEEEEAENIGIILLEKYNINETGNGLIDGASAFQRAKSHYKRASKKKIPLQKKKAAGVITKQKQQTTNKRIEKLDKVSENYLQYVRNSRGEEAAEKLRKSL